MATATIFKGFNNPVENRSLILITKDIQEGRYKQEIETLRNTISQGNKEQADKLKRQLLAFTPSATYTGGRKPGFITQYSQFIVLDLDKLQPEQLQTAFSKAASIPYTFCCFRSPGGNGLKILVEVNSTQEQHEQAYSQVASYYEQQTGLSIDRSGKDITRLCFVSFDPDLHKNISNKKFQVTVDNATIQEPQPTTSEKNKSNTCSESSFVFAFQQQVLFTNKKAQYSVGNRNNYIYRLAANCNRVGIPEADTLLLAAQQFDLPEKEITNSVHSAYTRNSSEHASYKLPEPTEDTQEEETVPAEPMPTLPDELFPLLPDFLKRVVQVASSKEERDILLLGSIVALSSCLPNLFGYYDNKKVNANLYLFITAQASAGKGRLVHCRQLVAPVHKEMRKQASILKQAYNDQVREIKQSKGKGESKETPPKPPEKMLIIPANNSSTGFFQLLNDSEGRGLIFETEGDTMVQAFKSDYGNYSHGFRNAFQHEPIQYYRRTEREYVEIERPCLSALLSGTPKQISALIPNAGKRII